MCCCGKYEGFAGTTNSGTYHGSWCGKPGGPRYARNCQSGARNTSGGALAVQRAPQKQECSIQ